MLKHIVYALLLGVGMAACLAETERTDSGKDTAGEQEIVNVNPDEQPIDADAFIIGQGQVGSIAIGMPVTQMRNQTLQHFILTDTLLHQEGQAYTAYHLRPEGSSTGLLLEQQCIPDCRVWRISVSSPRYKTAKGLGVGAVFSEVQQQYTISQLATSEAGLVAIAEEGGISFVLDDKALTQARLHRLKPADIPANTPVKRIFIY